MDKSEKVCVWLIVTLLVLVVGFFACQTLVGGLNEKRAANTLRTLVEAQEWVLSEEGEYVPLFQNLQVDGQPHQLPTAFAQEGERVVRYANYLFRMCSPEGEHWCADAWPVDWWWRTNTTVFHISQNGVLVRTVNRTISPDGERGDLRYIDLDHGPEHNASLASVGEVPTDMTAGDYPSVKSWVGKDGLVWTKDPKITCDE